MRREKREDALAPSIFSALNAVDFDCVFTMEGGFANWIRNKAYFLGKGNFKAIDLVIPIAFSIRDDHTEQVTLESMSYIVISVKNNSTDAEPKRQRYLSTNEIEGVPGEQGMMKSTRKGSSLKLTLHSLAFINPATNIIGDENLVNHWIKVSADKPYIAFTMSMGNTSLSDKSQLFIPGKPVRKL